MRYQTIEVKPGEWDVIELKTERTVAVCPSKEAAVRMVTRLNNEFDHVRNGYQEEA